MAGIFFNMKEIQLQPTNGFHLYGWMVTELHLEGPELLTFALVHNFTQGGAGLYKGNTTYLAAWTGWAENTCRKHLVSLTQKGLIQEIRGRENNSPFCYYKLVDDFYQKHPAISAVSSRKNLGNHPAKIDESTPQNLRGEYNNKNRNNRIEFIPPTPQEVKDYSRLRGFVDPEGFAAHFIDYYTQTKWHLANGKPMQDWKRAVITWEPNNKFRQFGKPTPSPLPSRSGNTTEDLLALGARMFGFKNE